MLEKEFVRLNDHLWEIESRPHPSDHAPIIQGIRLVNQIGRALSRATEQLEAKVMTLQTELDFLALEAHILDEREGYDEEGPDGTEH